MDKKCWEVMKCGREPGGLNVSQTGVCPAATECVSGSNECGKITDKPCWQVAGTFCRGDIQGTFAQKYLNCTHCEFYQKIKAEDGDKSTNGCAACGKEIKKKPIKRMGNLYCSIYCAELVSERLQNLNMQQIDFNALGPVVDRFMSTCQVCPLCLKCREDRPICSSYFEELHDYINIRWCCHCIYALSCMVSDGSVSFDTVKKVISKAEQIARDQGYTGVSQAIFGMAEAALMEDFSYIPYPNAKTEPPKEEHDHYMACVQCDKKFMEECFKLTEAAEKNLPKIEALLDKYPYCGHMHYEMAGMLLDPAVTIEKLEKLIGKTKQLAREKGQKGGMHRLHYIAIGRSI